MRSPICLDAMSRVRAQARASLGRNNAGERRSVFGRRCLQRRRPGSTLTPTSTSTFALFLAGSALDPSLVQFVVDEDYLRTSAAADLSSSFERILSSQGATSLSSPSTLLSSLSSSTNFPASVEIFDTADLATVGNVLNFLLHHPVSKNG